MKMQCVKFVLKFKKIVIIPSIFFLRLNLYKIILDRILFDYTCKHLKINK